MRCRICIAAGCFSCLLILGGIARSGEVVELSGTGHDANLIRPYAFTVHNNGTHPIAFYISADSEGWTRHQLGVEEIREFSDGSSNRYQIEIPTSGLPPVRYAIVAGKRYQIYWNAPSGRWDLVELRPQ